MGRARVLQIYACFPAALQKPNQRQHRRPKQRVENVVSAGLPAPVAEAFNIVSPVYPLPRTRKDENNQPANVWPVSPSDSDQR